MNTEKVKFLRDIILLLFNFLKMFVSEFKDKFGVLSSSKTNPDNFKKLKINILTSSRWLIKHNAITFY